MFTAPAVVRYAAEATGVPVLFPRPQSTNNRAATAIAAKPIFELPILTLASIGIDRPAPNLVECRLHDQRRRVEARHSGRPQGSLIHPSAVSTRRSGRLHRSQQERRVRTRQHRVPAERCFRADPARPLDVLVFTLTL